MDTNDKKIINGIEIKPKVLPFRCPVCNGFGTVKHGEFKCKSCNGKGYIEVEQEVKSEN